METYEDIELSFLNLDDCTNEERDLIKSILGEAKGSFIAVPGLQAPIKNEGEAKYDREGTVKESDGYPLPPCLQPPNHVDMSAQPTMPLLQQQVYNHQSGMPIITSTSMADYQSALEASVMTTVSIPPNTSAHTFSQYSTTANTSPYVYINQVTANVNVHHGPSQLQEDPQQQQHYAHQRMLPGQTMGPPPNIMGTHQGPPPNHMMSGFGQPPYISPFSNQSGGNLPKVPGQHGMYPFPFYLGSYPHLMGFIPTGSQQAMNRTPMPLIRGQLPHPQPLFHPPPPHVLNMGIPVSEMAPPFVAPPPMPVAVPVPIMSEAQPTVEFTPKPPILHSDNQQQQQALEVANLQPEVLPAQQTIPVQVSIGDNEEKAEKEDEEILETENFGFEIPDLLPEANQISEEFVILPTTATEEQPKRKDVAEDTLEEPAMPDESPAVEEDEPTGVEENHQSKEASAAKSASASPKEEAQTVQMPMTKSWASLFHMESVSNISGREFSNKPTALIHPYTGEAGDKSRGGAHTIPPGIGSVTLGHKEAKMAGFLQSYILNHKAQSLKPRGLSNRSNWCFVNAIMQSLVACPPFFNLMKSLPDDVLDFKIGEENYQNANSPMKILSAVNSFVSEFNPLENFPRISHRKEKIKKQEDLPLDKTFEASSIFQMLLNLNSDMFKVVEGRQEDAEEFLTFLLNGLNDEMLSVLKLLTTTDESPEEEESGTKFELGADDDEWQEVGPKNRSCVTRRGGDLGSTSGLKTPIADMFQGQVRSSVSRSAGETSATLQPFFTLQLDIQSEGIRNVSDALSHNFAVETLDGYVCSRTKQEMEASRSLHLEELPPILILHLKRFIYDITSGGCQKLLKNIDFPVDLEIPKDILSPQSRGKYSARQRTYKLFAVVYHNGTEATKGHYVGDIYHTGLSSWIHCDDSTLRSISENMVLSHSASSMPYILFYRRGDTMGGGNQEKTKGSAPANKTSPVVP